MGNYVKKEKDSGKSNVKNTASIAGCCPCFVDVRLCGEGWRQHWAEVLVFLAPPYGWSIWSHQNKRTWPTFPCTHGKHWVRSHTHTHSQGRAHKNREKKVNGASRFTPGSQVTGSFPKQHFLLSFSSLWLLCYLETCHMFPLSYRVTVGQFILFLKERCFFDFCQMCSKDIMHDCYFSNNNVRNTPTTVS